MFQRKAQTKSIQFTLHELMNSFHYNLAGWKSHEKLTTCILFNQKPKINVMLARQDLV